eukprot:sb/3469755/
MANSSKLNGIWQRIDSPNRTPKPNPNQTLTVSPNPSRAPAIDHMCLTSDEAYKRSYVERKRTPSLDSPPQRTSLDFHSDNEALKMLDEMQYFREQRFFCDVTIVVGEKEIEAHRIVLSSCSPYFRAMFTTNLAESKQDKVHLHDVDSDAIETLIDYAYTHQVSIGTENVQALLPAARMLQLDYVVEQLVVLGAIIIRVPCSDFTGARYQKSILRPNFFKRL